MGKRIFDSLGQGSYGAALASSLKNGYDITLGEFITDLGPMHFATKLVNTHLKTTLEQARRSARMIGLGLRV